MGRHSQASLGHIVFSYQPAGSDGTLLAFDGPSKKLLWSLKLPLNGDSIIQCYDNQTLLIKSADGYTRLVTAEDGKMIKAWAPGAEAPAAAPQGGVNPFGTSAAPGNARQAKSSFVPGTSLSSGQDQEKRMELIEENIRLLTEEVNRLLGEKNEQGNSSVGKN